MNRTEYVDSRTPILPGMLSTIDASGRIYLDVADFIPAATMKLPTMHRRSHVSTTTVGADILLTMAQRSRRFHGHVRRQWITNTRTVHRTDKPSHELPDRR